MIHSNIEAHFSLLYYHITLLWATIVQVKRSQKNKDSINPHLIFLKDEEDQLPERLAIDLTPVVTILLNINLHKREKENHTSNQTN